MKITFRVKKKDGIPASKILNFALICWKYFSDVHITVEPVREPQLEEPPESKPEEPKPAEPQGWEQRFCEDYCRDGCKPENRRTCKQLAFIRAERERVHTGYAPLISAIEMAFKEADFLPDGRLTRQARAVFEPIRKAEQNRHREGGE